VSGTATDADVLVAGAGPAGVAVAVALAAARPDLVRRGRIVCLDRARFPREKPCGGGLTGHARAALETLGLAVRVPLVACRTGRIVYGAAARAVPLAQPVDVVRRAELDADLVAQARARGVTVLEGEGVAGYAVDEASATVTVTTGGGRRLTARVLVAADGAGSRIRQALVAGDRHAPARPLRLFKHEVTAPPALAADMGEAMIYDFTPMDEGLRGYVWLFPVAGGRVNVGAMHYPSRRLGGAAVTRILDRALGRYGIRLPSAARGWPAWPYARRARIAAPHVIAVGDAAGIDALTGEGIAVGLEHGPLAASAIARALDSGDFSFDGFAAAVRAAVVGRELALDGRLAAMLYAPRGFGVWLSLVMFDARMRALYAARVCGSAVLADRPGALVAALGRHALAAPVRLARLGRASRAGAAAAAVASASTS
jgi:flavin-dependent dehydrogenase